MPMTWATSLEAAGLRRRRLRLPRPRVGCTPHGLRNGSPGAWLATGREVSQSPGTPLCWAECLGGHLVAGHHPAVVTETGPLTLKP